jgi:N-acetylglucosamine-6-phosphate deacetylase
MAEAIVLTGARVVLPSGIIEDGRVTVRGRRITGNQPEELSTLDLTGHWIVPGFVDIHVHGGGGASFSAGTAEEALSAIGTHRRHGTTTMLASTVTGDLGDLARQAAALSELVEQGDLAGIHFEGPFLSPHRCGAHDPGLLRDPHPSDVRQLLAASRGAARMLTLAVSTPCDCWPSTA